MVEIEVESEIARKDLKVKRLIPFEPRSLLPSESLCILVLSDATTPLNAFAVYREMVRKIIREYREKFVDSSPPISTEVPGNEKELRAIVKTLKERLAARKMDQNIPNVRTIAGSLDDLSVLGWINKREMESIGKDGKRKRIGHAVAVYFLSEDIELKAKEYFKQRGVI